MQAERQMIGGGEAQTPPVSKAAPHVLFIMHPASGLSLLAQVLADSSSALRPFGCARKSALA